MYVHSNRVIEGTADTNPSSKLASPRLRCHTRAPGPRDDCASAARLSMSGTTVQAGLSSTGYAHMQVICDPHVRSDMSAEHSGGQANLFYLGPELASVFDQASSAAASRVTSLLYTFILAYCAISCSYRSDTKLRPPTRHTSVSVLSLLVWATSPRWPRYSGAKSSTCGTCLAYSPVKLDRTSLRRRHSLGP